MTVEHGGNIFAVARERGWDWHDVLDLSASINPLGPSPHVRETICGAIERIVHYPEREPVQLTRALGELWRIDPDRILLGNGATDLIHFFAHHEETQPTLVVPTFSEFHRVWPTSVCVDWDGPSSWPDEGLLVFTNPNNPCGDFRHVERDAPTLVDESFIEFTGEESAVRHSDHIVLRSLTKFYALPGLRIGALVGSVQQMHEWKKRRAPWQVNVLAEAAALAAISDIQHARETVEFVRTERAWLFAKLSALPGVYPRPSVANYFSVALDRSADELCSAMLERKILVRRIDASSIRIAVRTRPENERFLFALENWL